jgi:4-hydroxy-2-oxoheptanedioate aldolase
MRINRAVELLEEDQPIYYTGDHTGHVLTYDQGKVDSQTWADYINVGMEHGCFDMTGLAEYLRGLVDGGPTPSGHRTPAVIVEAPVDGIDEANIRYNAWQFRQILARGVHGVLLCQAESADAVRAFVESCRYPNQLIGVDPTLPSPIDRMRGESLQQARAGKDTTGRQMLGVGTRGRGSESITSDIWGVSPSEYMERCDPWPLNPRGELLLGVKLESPEGIANYEEILAVPGLGFAEIGPGDLSLSLGYSKLPGGRYTPEMMEARNRVLAACRKRRIAFLESGLPENVAAKIDEGVRVIHVNNNVEAARIGRAHSRRAMPA